MARVTTTRKPRKAVSKPKYALPTGPKEPDPDFANYVTCIYGTQGVGKSTFMANYDNVLMMSFERVSRSLRCADFNHENGGVTSWGVYLEAMKLLKEEGGFQVVAIDTIEAAYQKCMDYVCKQNGIEHPQDAPYGKGWNAVRTEFVRGISLVADMGLGLVFSSHAKEAEISTFSGSTYHRVRPSMPGACYDVVQGITDFVLFADYALTKDRKPIRVIFTTGDEMIDAKHPECSVAMPRILPLDIKKGPSIVAKAFTEGAEGLDILDIRTSTRSKSSTGEVLSKMKAQAVKKGVKR